MQSDPENTDLNQETPSRAMAIRPSGPAVSLHSKAGVAATVSAVNFNPYHDELGRFTTSGAAAGQREIDYSQFPGRDKLDGHGKLVFQELYQDGFPAYWYDTDVYYPQGSRRGVKLRRNLRAMNVFLAAEVRRPKTVQNFLKEHLWYFLRGNLGNSVIDASVITRRGIEGVADESLVEADRRSAARRARRLAQLQVYARSDELVAVAGNGWTEDANVITGDGAVEHWLVRGTVQPLQIGSFLCELKEPAGTFKPTPVWL